MSNFYTDNDYYYLASYPKSGNTWVRLFIKEISRLLDIKNEDVLPDININKELDTGMITSSRVWISDQLGINSCDFSFKELDLVRGKCGKSKNIFNEGDRFHKTHDAFISKDSDGNPVLETNYCKGVVYILRHPEDIVISLSHFFKLNYDESVEFLLNKDSALVPHEGLGNNQVRQYMGRWDKHVLSWVDQEIIPSIVMRYEDMKFDPITSFSKISSFLNLTNDIELIKKAIDNTSIEKIKDIEKRLKGFKEKPAQCDSFFRSGRTGEGAEKLSFIQKEKLYKKMKKVMNRFGYELSR